MFRRIREAVGAIVIAAALVLSAAVPLRTEAATSTARVTGTVQSGTSDVTLYLKLNDGTGTMQIRMDSDTDTSECRLLVVGGTVTADVYRGSDAFMHASKLISGSVTTVDTGNQTTVTGTVASGTTENLLLLTTAQGTMKIKIDADTDLKDAGILYTGKSLKVVVARGEDAYMHAVSVSFLVESTHPGAVTVTGTVASGTDQSYLYLNTSDGTMKIRIDADTDTEAGRVLVPGNTVSAEVYRGDDAYMHAAKIVGRADTLSSSTTTLVRGTVSSGTTTSILHLQTEQGLMQIKIDSTTDMSAGGLLLEGQYLYVTVARGSDAYMHAIQIVNPNYSPSAATGSAAAGSASHANTTEVKGAPLNSSTDDVLYLETKDGNYTIRLDSDTDMASKAFMTGHTTKVSIYPGNDGYFHAARVSDDQFTGSQAKVSSNTVEITGTLEDKSSLNQINVKTSDGVFKLRIDKSTVFDGVRFLKEGRTLHITIAGADDGYMHAVKISQ